MKKRTINHIFLSIMLLAFFATVGCKDKEDKDKVPPILKVLAPTEMAKFSRGGVMIVNADVSDNKGLKNMELNLMSQKTATGIDTPWSPAMHNIMLGGKEMQIRNIAAFGEIPYDIMSGKYTLNIKLFDEAGNARTAAVNIEIE